MSKIAVDRQILEQALEALEYENSWHAHHKVKPYVSTIDAIAALRATLEQPEQEPVAWLRREELADLQTCNYRHLGADSPRIWAPYQADVPDPEQGLVPFYTHPPSRDMEQEPVALWHRSGDGYSPVTVEQSHPPEPLTLDEALAQGWRRFYTHPPRREWRGLTEEERRECTASPFVVDNYRAIVYKLKELNHHE